MSQYLYSALVEEKTCCGSMNWNEQIMPKDKGSNIHLSLSSIDVTIRISKKRYDLPPPLPRYIIFAPTTLRSCDRSLNARSPTKGLENTDPLIWTRTPISWWLSPRSPLLSWTAVRLWGIAIDQFWTSLWRLQSLERMKEDSLGTNRADANARAFCSMLCVFVVTWRFCGWRFEGPKWYCFKKRMLVRWVSAKVRIKRYVFEDDLGPKASYLCCILNQWWNADHASLQSLLDVSYSSYQLSLLIRAKTKAGCCERNTRFCILKQGFRKLTALPYWIGPC